VWYSVVFPVAVFPSIIRMGTESYTLILSCVLEVTFCRTLNVFLNYIRKSLLVVRIENSMIESTIFQTTARDFCWVVN